MNTTFIYKDQKFDTDMTQFPEQCWIYDEDNGERDWFILSSQPDEKPVYKWFATELFDGKFGKEDIVFTPKKWKRVNMKK